MAENGKRITLRSLFSEILSVLNFERGVFYTLREMTIRPRTFITSYLDGDRARSVNPFRFLILTTALTAFLSLTFVFDADKLSFNFEDTQSSAIQFDFGDSTDGASTLDEALEAIPDAEKQQEVKDFVARIMAFLNNWLNLIVLLIIPVFAFFCWIFFRKRKWNYAEFLTTNAFIFSWTNIVFILSAPLILYESGMLVWVFRIAALGTLYLIIATMRSRNWVVASIAAFGAAFVTMILTVFLVSGLLELFVVGG